ncbi:MAG: hypothetical protein AAF902_25825 [Chloroflexota bacterium]
MAAPKTDIDQAVQAIELTKNTANQTAGLDTTSQTNQLEKLRAFWGMMDEFWRAFDAVAQVEIPALHAQNILPPVNTITKCIRHTTIDFEIVQRAIQQRESANDAQARSLLITDKLADMSLAPFQFLFGDTNTTVTPITFFGKDVYIRQVPYSNQVMFIGLTYDLVASINDSSLPPFELLAIPHEMGHFLYHYENKTIFPAANQHSVTHSHKVPARHSGRFKHRPPTPHTVGWLSQHPDIQANPYHHWCEEIFADLFGCLVSGPFTALGIQAILATGDKERLMLDDALHPTPIMRPYLISEMLRVLSDKVENYNFKETAMLLDANWTTILDRWGIVLEDVYNGRPASIIVPRDAAAHLEPFTRVNTQTAIVHSRKIMEHFADGLLAEYTDAAGNKHKADLSAGAWCTPQDTLTKYAVAFGEMVQAKAKPEGVDKTLQKIVSPTAKLDLLESVSDTQNTRRNFVEVGASLFKNLAGGWHDSGPKGSSFGGT